MDCTFESATNAIIVHVDGRVDEATWQDFGRSLSDGIAQATDARLPKLIIDLSRLAYMSSRGLRVLTVAKREAEDAGIVIDLASPNEVMREILSISRYDKLFTVTSSVEATD